MSGVRTHTQKVPVVSGQVHKNLETIFLEMATEIQWDKVSIS